LKNGEQVTIIFFLLTRFYTWRKGGGKKISCIHQRTTNTMSTPSGHYTTSEDHIKRIKRGRGKQLHHNVPAGHFADVPTSISHFVPNNPNKEWYRAGTNADGTCFYHTVGYAINYRGYWTKDAEEQQKLGKHFRKVIFDNTTEAAWERFWEKKGVGMAAVPNIDEIRKQISNSRTWADVFAILYVCDVLRLNILVFDVSAGSLYCGTHNAKRDRPTILMAWIQNSHFEPLMELDTKTFKVRTLFSKSIDGKGVLDHILREYEKQGCPNVTIHQILRRRARNKRRRRRKQRRRNRN